MEQTNPTNSQNTSVSYPNQSDEGKALASIASILNQTDNLLPILRREFRGEASMQYEDGSMEYIQILKPMFVRVNQETQEPLRQKVKYKTGEIKEIYLPNDEAIEEILSMLKFMGLNKITMMTNIDEKTILQDLLEFECKLAAVLGLKQKEWGIDKELMPMIQSKIKTMVQDARYMCCNGSTIKAIQKTVQRIEQFSEGEKSTRKLSPYT